MRKGRSAEYGAPWKLKNASPDRNGRVRGQGPLCGHPVAPATEEPQRKETAHPAAGARALFMCIHNNNNFTRELTSLSRLCQVYVPDGTCLPHLIYCRVDQLCLSPGQACIWHPVGKILSIWHSCPHIIFPRAIIFLSVKGFLICFSLLRLFLGLLLSICQQQICLSTFMSEKRLFLWYINNATTILCSKNTRG